MPTSIDKTCGTNVSTALNTWIAGRPNGSTLVFPPGSCYQLGGDAGLNLKGRDGLTLVGTGSTLQLRTTGASNFSSAFFLQSSTHITIRGFTVDGMNTTTGTTGAASAIDEHINGAAIRAGSSFIEFDQVTWDRIRGFGVIISSDGGSVWPTDISIHDSTVRGGEMGIAVVAGQRIDIVRNHIRDSVYIAIDLEPDYGTDGYRDVLIKDNQITRYAWGQNLTSWFVAANPADAAVSAAVMDGLTITGNQVHFGAATADNGNADGIGGLGIRADKSNLKRDVVITNNTTTDNDTQSSSRGVIYLANVRNLTVTGNRQPIANGAAFVRDSGTTGTRVVSGNNTNSPPVAARPRRGGRAFVTYRVRRSASPRARGGRETVTAPWASPDHHGYDASRGGSVDDRGPLVESDKLDIRHDTVLIRSVSLLGRRYPGWPGPVY